MKISTSSLKVGDTMLTGEKVISITRDSLSLATDKIRVCLMNIKRKTTRLAEWNKHSTVSIQD